MVMIIANASHTGANSELPATSQAIAIKSASPRIEV
jgi:hypothetical protein